MAEKIGIKTLLAFPYSSVFSAFGASTTDVQHFYSRTLTVSDEADALERNARELESLIQQATRDMEVEGFVGERVSAALYAVRAHNSDEATLVGLCRLAEASSQRWSDELLTVVSGDHQHLAVEVRLVVEARVPHWNGFGSATESCAAYRPPVKSARQVHWNANGPTSTPIFDAQSLASGASIDGPAIVESPITNYIIASGWRFAVDGRNHYLFEWKSD
jgi:N-methylhydantoinase A/oxoprolinase/acetone carboxylase beta subunit